MILTPHIQSSKPASDTLGEPITVIATVVGTLISWGSKMNWFGWGFDAEAKYKNIIEHMASTNQFCAAIPSERRTAVLGNMPTLSDEDLYKVGQCLREGVAHTQAAVNSTSGHEKKVQELWLKANQEFLKLHGEITAQRGSNAGGGGINTAALFGDFNPGYLLIPAGAIGAYFLIKNFL